MDYLSYKQGLSWLHGTLFYIVMICLHLARAAEPVSLFPSKDNEDISALCYGNWEKLLLMPVS